MKSDPGSSSLILAQVRFDSHDVIPLAVNVRHGVPHQVHQDLVVLLVQLHVSAQKRRESKKWNPERQAPSSSLIHNATVGIENTENKKCKSKSTKLLNQSQQKC